MAGSNNCSNDMNSLKGHFLIASPKLMDPNFSRSVVLLVQHGEEGAMGLVVNRPMEMTVKEAWEQVSESTCAIQSPIHQGGPCEGPLMVVHADGSAGQLEVIPGLYFTTDREAVERLVEENQTQMKFFVGYSGWGPGQLENELEEGGWLVAAATDDLVFAPPHDLWNDIMRAALRAAGVAGLNPKVVPEDPSFN